MPQWIDCVIDDQIVHILFASQKSQSVFIIDRYPWI